MEKNKKIKVWVSDQELRALHLDEHKVSPKIEDKK